MHRTKLDDVLAFSALFGTFACGYLGAPSSSIVVGAISLTLLRVEHHCVLADKHAAFGWWRMWSMFAAASIAGTTLQCSLAFGGGQLLAM
jgi:hypothetical protein